MKYIILIILSISAAGCNTGTKKNNKKYPDSTSATDSIINSAGSSADSAYREGARLIAANDCFTCHKVDEKLNGPSYKEIAAKYHFNQGNVENLTHSIINGSKGIWGEQQMVPHPNITVTDAKEMVRFILSLDTTGKGS